MTPPAEKSVASRQALRLPRVVVATFRRGGWRLWPVAALMLVASLGAELSPAGAAGVTTTHLISVGSTGTQSNGSSKTPSVSAHGRFVAFDSDASNLVPHDTNASGDVFVYDRLIGKTELISVSSSGVQGNDNSYGQPSISAHGRFVAFYSDASNLVRQDTNGTADVFVYDRSTGKTRGVSVSSSGVQGNDDSAAPSISAHGRFVAFDSYASNLVRHDTNATTDVFVYDRSTRKTRRVSVNSAGAQGNSYSGAPSISPHGRFVAFVSDAWNLVRHDSPAGWRDAFVYDRSTGKTQRVSVSSSDTQGNANSLSVPSISAGSRFVAFISDASNLVRHDTNARHDVFVYDRSTHKMQRVSVSSAGTQGNNESFEPSISADGRFVAFYSDASNLVRHDTNAGRDVFVYDRSTRKTHRVSVSSAGEQGNDTSYSQYGPSISADGRFVAFVSDASNLVDTDTNAATDAFIRGPMR